MEMKLLTTRQLFCTKRETIEKKVNNYFTETKDVDSVIEYAIAIMVRHALVLGDFSFVFPDIIREIYLHAKPSETMKRFLPFFKDYFSNEEWKAITERLFISEKKYLKATKTARLHESYLRNRGNALVLKEYGSYVLVSIFEDANGKRHNWRLRDADPKNTTEETKRILQILTTLTIFQKDHVRRFAKYVDFDTFGTTLISSSKEEKMHASKAAASAVVDPSVTEIFSDDQTTLLDGYDLNLLNKGQLILLIKGIFERAEASFTSEEEFREKDRMSDFISGSRAVSQKKERNQNQAVISSSTTKHPKEQVPVSIGAETVENSETKVLENTNNKDGQKRPSKQKRKLLQRFSKKRKSD